MKLDRYVKKTYDDVNIYFSKSVTKQLEKLPSYVRIKLFAWCDLVGDQGLIEARKYKGLHDEPLKGRRKGQRSARLTKAYRVIYFELNNVGNNSSVVVIEVNKHEY